MAIYSKSIVITYHKLRIHALLNSKPTYSPATGLSFYDHKWCIAFDGHRDKLVELGYLERKEFHLKHISCPSIELRRLIEEFTSAFPNNPYTMDYGPDIPPIITVWVQPENFPEWERIISAHDAPSTNLLAVESQEECANLLRFVGKWAGEEGELCYSIIKKTDNSIEIKSPPNEIWREVIKNIRLDGRKLIFDQFLYTDPSEDYKTIVNKSGEHPFSGVRCKSVFEIKPDDTNVMHIKISASGKYGTYSAGNEQEILRKVE